MMPSRGLVRTSATGARFRPTPAAARPEPFTRSSERTLSGPPCAISRGHGGEKGAFTFDTSPPSSSSITRIGCVKHADDDTAAIRSVHDFKSAARPPKFGVNSSTPPTWSLCRYERTTSNDTDPRQEKTMTEPMSASTSHGSADGSGANEGTGDVTDTAARRGEEGRP